jgi:GTPase SAR1 family protein
VVEKWHKELQHYCPKVPILLVGTKTDLRNDSDTLVAIRKKGWEPVLSRQGSLVAQKVQAVGYLECSAKTKDGINKIFDDAVVAALKGGEKGGSVVKAKTRRFCSLI